MSEFKFRNRSLSYQQQTLIMGILNVTPDSFSDGGEFNTVTAALQHVETMLLAGADIIDIGGESTRPGSIPISATAEIERVAPIVKAIKQHFPHAIISIDTWKHEVAQSMLELGADIINDVFGLHGDPQLATVIAQYQAGVIIMNNPSYYLTKRPQSTIFPIREQQSPPPGDLIATIDNIMQDTAPQPPIVRAAKVFLSHAVQIAHQAGIKDSHIMLDPGLGFGVSIEENLELIKYLYFLKELDTSYPILSAPSRKRFIKGILETDVRATETSYLNTSAPQEQVDRMMLDYATGAVCTLSVQAGANAVRIHNIPAIKPMLTITDKLCRSNAHKCYLSLGSNLGDSEYYIREAVHQISALEGVSNLHCASLYETKPWGNTEQQNFINTVISLDYTATPYKLLADCQKIEQQLGRVRHEHWGPRTIDIDIIFFGKISLDDPQLTVPHPYYQERDFVLIPLHELHTGEIKANDDVKFMKKF